MDCFAEPVIGRIRATRWLAMMGNSQCLYVPQNVRNTRWSGSGGSA
jgi:hypothetical protein